MATAAVISGVAGVASLYFANEQRKASIDASRANARAADLDKRRAEAQALRAAKRQRVQVRRQQAQIVAQAAATGGSGSSGVQTSVGSLQSSLSGNLAFQSSDMGFAGAVFNEQNSARRSQERAANYGAYSQIAGTASSYFASKPG